MRNLPLSGFEYSGLTVILDKPSRFDTKNLCSGYAGGYFDQCLASAGNSKLHRGTIEIRTLASMQYSFLPGTKALLLLGEETLKRYNPNVSLQEQRGSPFTFNGLTCVASFTPQDAQDRRDYFTNDDDENDDKAEAETAEGKTTHGRTRRRNWRFWMRQDIKKAVRLTTQPLVLPEPTYHYWPEIGKILHLLNNVKGVNFYFDIETDRHLQMTCFGFSLDEGENVYVVPMLQTHLKPSTYYYTDTHKILQALAVALRDNVVVIHNSMFDLFVLAYRYGIPLTGPVYDTMLAHNRCYIEVEKSLGHVISLHTDLPYHKNEGVFEPHNQAQTQQLYEYNGKDVFALARIKPAIDATAARLGATESVRQVNRSVLPYLTMTLQGMRLNEPKITTFVDYHRRFNAQIERILHFVTGQEFNPNSWQQVSGYLYDGLGIPKPDKDPTNEKTLLTLLLKHDVPAIHCILKYRGNQKRISKAGLRTKKGEPTYWHGAKFFEKTESPRVTTSWGLARTTTMRVGSTKLLRRWGTNLQNYEKEIRKVVMPDLGKVFLQIDQSGAEALIVAYLCRHGQFRDLFLTGVNPHVFLGMHLFQEQFEAELGFSLADYIATPVKNLSSMANWKEIAKCIKASDDSKDPSKRYYFIAKQGNHCVDNETEVLTPDGWVNVSSLDHNNKIATFNKDTSEIAFEVPSSWVCSPYTGEMLTFETKMLSQCVTPNHRMLYKPNVAKRYGHLRVREARELTEIRYANIPTSGDYRGGTIALNPAVAKLIVATQADGCIYGEGRIRFRFKNASKAERIRELLAEAKLEYAEKCYVDDCPFVFLVRDAQIITNYFKPKKVYGSWLLTFTPETLDIIIDELKMWDGYQYKYDNHARTQCQTIEPENADWLKTIIHLRNQQSSVAVDYFKGGENRLYTVSVNQRKFTRLVYSDADHKMGESKQYDGMVYCPTVSTGFFLIRRNGHISVTGNSLNYDAKARAFQSNTLLKSEGSVALSLVQSQDVITKRQALFPEIISWQQDVVVELRKTQVLRNLFGHPRVFTGWIDEQMYKEAYAFKAQSTVGQITNYGITEMQEEILADHELLLKAEADVLQNNHDSMLVQCLPEFKEAVARKMQHHMNRDLVSPRGETFQMKTDVQWSETSWGEMKELKL